MGLGVALSLVLLAAGPSPDAGEAGSPAAIFQVHIPHEATAGAVRRSLQGAYDRLKRPRCQQIFSEFRDLSGRPLQDTLYEMGLTGQAYLGLVNFCDGSRHARCASRQNLAVASRGGRVVYVCPEQFRNTARRSPALAEYLLIHEMLHSLGLGENPPSSQEVTSRVARRCR